MGTSIGSTVTLWGAEPSSCAAANDGYADFLREQDEKMSFGPDVSDLHRVILLQLSVQGQCGHCKQAAWVVDNKILCSASACPVACRAPAAHWQCCFANHKV
jgi:hypothetical protein